MVGLSLTACSAPRAPQLIDIPGNVPPRPGVAVPPVDINAPGRTSGQLTQWAEDIQQASSIPAAAAAAYGNAAAIMAATQPSCGLTWTTLAGIGWVETRHGHIYGGKLNTGGYVTPPVFGIILDGSPGFENIPDTDGGALDADTTWDRAVGPMQFIPQSWNKYGTDANGNGLAEIQQIDDAALASARLLCDFNRDLSTRAGWQQAILAYNQSAEYVVKVAFAANAYSVGTRP